MGVDVFHVEREHDIGLIQEPRDMHRCQRVRRGEGVTHPGVDHRRADSLSERDECLERLVSLCDVPRQDHGPLGTPQRVDHPRDVLG